ncbi:hypothetical protein Glove_271g116 [Diversispora epigaea]|uniref:ribonuclease H n=1 Tax=Diversispora epigaea TaxID=1348612 RepID=A0A397IBB3_9GLOM|nr:hypothetical protein Glove_271g116 [Diversispora epigaea]
MNLNFKDILDWHHIQTTRPKRGKPPGWYTYIDQKKDYITNMIQDKKEYKRGKQVIDKRNTQKLKHYNIVTTNLEPTSVLLPCEGCEINTKENNEECVYRLDKNKEDKIEIPVIYSKKSTSNTLTKSFKNRIRMNVKDLYRATAIMENYEEDVQETLNIPLNIIDEEDNQRKSEYHEIQKWINCEDENIRELIYIKEKLKNKKQVKVYTDGSLETTLTENIMGFGWVIPEVKDYERLTFRGNIKNFLSSTRAELMAIFTALIVMPKRSKVIIYTDSACAIQNIKIITKQINTRKIWTENNNPVILQMINDIVQERRLKIICHKVKAHSGDKYNEIADSLAKIPGFIEGITNNIFEGTTISLNYNNITDRSFIPIWKFIPIETPVKDTIKEINRLKLMLNFKYQERFKYIMTNTKCREIDWDLTFKTKHPSKITSDITNKEDSNKRSFALKLLCEELPTLSKRYIHKPNLYSSSSCILCEKLVEEDNMHVFMCKRKGQIDPIKNLTNKFKEILIEKIKKEEPGIDIKIIKKVERRLKIICHKVKAHSGDKYNEIADSLAKIPGFIEGITNNIFEGTTISLNYNNITDRSFIPIWKFIPIETPVKDTIKEINRLKLMLNFKYQERFKYIMTNTKCREIDWDLTFKTKHPSKITSDITNKEDSNKRSFALKLLCEELPTLSKRYIHKPNLYSSSSCILCEKLVEEDNMHVFMCKRKGQIDPIKNLTNKFKEILIEKIKKEEPGIDIKIIKKVVSEVDILNYTYEKDYTLLKNYSDLSFFDVIKGFIPNILVTKVKKICRNKKAKANKIIIDVLEEFQKILKQIWKERCDKVIEWEIKNGITNKDKRTRQIRNDKRTKIQIDKTSNIKEGNLHISKMMEKINFQRKQKQKEEDLEFFTNEIFLNTFTYKGNNLYKIKIFSDGDMAISS